MQYMHYYTHNRFTAEVLHEIISNSVKAKRQLQRNKPTFHVHLLRNKHELAFIHRTICSKDFLSLRPSRFSFFMKLATVSYAIFTYINSY